MKTNRKTISEGKSIKAGRNTPPLSKRPNKPLPQGFNKKSRRRNENGK